MLCLQQLNMHGWWRIYQEPALAMNGVDNGRLVILHDFQAGSEVSHLSSKHSDCRVDQVVFAVLQSSFSSCSCLVGAWTLAEI